MVLRSGVRFPSLRVFTIAALAAVMLGALTFSMVTRQAAGQTAATTLEACINRYTGTVRMSSPGRSISCSPTETRIEWSQQGPPGPAGPAGPAGAMGPAGPAATLPVLSALPPMTVACTNGDSVLSGGYEFISDTDGFTPPHVVTSRPHDLTQTQEGWLVEVFHDDSRLITDVFAVCASATDADNIYRVNQRHDTGGQSDGGDGGDDGGDQDGR